MLEQRYNYVIQSRRTIETFPVCSPKGCESDYFENVVFIFLQCALAKYPLLEIIAQPQHQLHCQVHKISPVCC